MEKYYFVWLYVLVNVISVETVTRSYYCDLRHREGFQESRVLPSLSFSTEEPRLLMSLEVCTESEYRMKTLLDYRNISLDAASYINNCNSTRLRPFHPARCHLSKFEDNIEFSSKYCAVDVPFTSKAIQTELCYRKRTCRQVLIDPNGDIIAPTKMKGFYCQQRKQPPQKNTKHERKRMWMNTAEKCLKRKHSLKRFDVLSELNLRKKDMANHLFGPTVNLVYRFTIRIVSGTKYTPELREPSSWQFKTLAKSIQNLVDRTLKQSTLALLYLSTQVTSFRRGSVISTFTVRLSASSGVSGSAVQSAIANAMNGSSNSTVSLVLDPTPTIIGSHGHASTSVTSFTGVTSAMNATSVPSTVTQARIETTETVTNGDNSYASPTSVEDVAESMLKSTLSTLVTSFASENSSNSTTVESNKTLQQTSSQSLFDVLTSVVMLHTSSTLIVQVASSVSPTNATSLNSSLTPINTTKTLSMPSSVSGSNSNWTSLTDASLLHSTLPVAPVSPTSLNFSQMATNSLKTSSSPSSFVAGSASNLTSSVQVTLLVAPKGQTASSMAVNITKTPSSSSASISERAGDWLSSTGALYEVTNMSTKLKSSHFNPNVYVSTTTIKTVSSEPLKIETQTLSQLPSTSKPSLFSSPVDVQGSTTLPQPQPSSVDLRKSSSASFINETPVLQPSSGTWPALASLLGINVSASTTMLQQEQNQTSLQLYNRSQPTSYTSNASASFTTPKQINHTTKFSSIAPDIPLYSSSGDVSEATTQTLSQLPSTSKPSPFSSPVDVQESTTLPQPQPSSVDLRKSSSASFINETPVLQPSSGTWPALASLLGINVSASTTMLQQEQNQTSLQLYNRSQPTSYTSSASASFTTPKQINHTTKFSSIAPDIPLYSSSGDVSEATTQTLSQLPSTSKPSPFSSPVDVQESTTLPQPQPSSVDLRKSSSASFINETPVLQPSSGTWPALASLLGINVSASTTMLQQEQNQTSLQLYNRSQPTSYTSSASASFTTPKQINHTTKFSSIAPDIPLYSSSGDVSEATTTIEIRNPAAGVSSSDVASLENTMSSSYLLSVQITPTAVEGVTATAASEPPDIPLYSSSGDVIAATTTTSEIRKPTVGVSPSDAASLGNATTSSHLVSITLFPTATAASESQATSTQENSQPNASTVVSVVPQNISTDTGIYSSTIQVIASPTATSKLFTVTYPGSSYISNTSYTVSSASISGATTAGVPVTSTVAPVPNPTPNYERDVEVSLQLLSETFHPDLENRSSSMYQNLSAKVNTTLTDLYSRKIPGFKEVTINSFSNGSVIVNHSVALSSSSTATTQQLEKTLKDANGTKNPGGFVFGQITTEEKCTPSYCMNSGTCQSNSQGAYCSCSSNYKGNRCDKLKDPVHGNYSNWSDFGECSKTCSGGRQNRRRSCTSPSPQYGGNNCSILGPEVESRDCNEDVRCPADWWIALAVCLGILVVIFVLLLVLIIRRRRMRLLQRAGQTDGPCDKRYIPPSHSKTDGTRNTMVPLETMAIRNRTNSPRGSPEGHRNPEFINDNKDDEDDDIYKTQLLLFLKQHHLVAPGYGQDSASVTSEQSRRQSREASAYSEQNNQDDYNYGDHQGAYENEEIDVDSIQIADSDTRRVSGASYTSRDGKR